MEEGKKKPIMIGVIVACLILAGAITYFRTVGGQEDFSVYAGEMIWVVCTNQDCNAQYSMDKQAFYEEVKKKGKGYSKPVLTCKDCDEDSLYEAIKCEKCEAVFFEGAVSGEGIFGDTCPECGHSAFKAKQQRLFEK